MSISKKIKSVNNNIERNKGQFNLDRQTATISALSSGNVSKNEFLTGKDVLPEKDWLEKAAALKKFKYSPLGKKLKKQTSVAEKQYQKFHNTHRFDRIKKEKGVIKKYNRLNLVYDSKYSFYEYYNIPNCSTMSPESIYPVLLLFFNDLNKFNNPNKRKKRTKEKKATAYDNA